jgi:transcriptional/translational regulatory protein YebC/TACO1
MVVEDAKHSNMPQLDESKAIETGQELDPEGQSSSKIQKEGMNAKFQKLLTW